MAANNQEKVNYKFKTGEASKFVYPSPTVHIRLYIDPSDATTDDDKYKLFATNGNYSKTLTVKDDKIDGDKFIDLVFEGLKSDGKYTLEIDPGAEGKPYKVFEDVPFKDLVELYSLLEDGDELEEVKGEEEKEDKIEEDLKDFWSEKESWGGDPEETKENDDSGDNNEEEKQSPIDWSQFNFKE